MKNKIGTGVQNLFGSMMFPFFLGMVVLVFFLVPVKYRPVVLLFSSYLACAFISLYALAVLAAYLSGFGQRGFGLKIFKIRKKAVEAKSQRYQQFVHVFCCLQY